MAQHPEILIIDDIAANRELLQQTLEPQGYEIIAVPSGTIGLHIAQQACPDLILLDIVMPESIDGFETCRRFKTNPVTHHIPVIFITARDDEAAITEGFAAGAVDYITKPFRPKEVLLRVATHLKISQLTRSLQEQNAQLEAEMGRRQRAEHERNMAIDAQQRSDEQLQHLSRQEAEHWGIAGFIGHSPTITRILNDVRRLQDNVTTSVLITGESGTGKELIARAIHFGGPRAKGPFIPVNCSAIPADLAESTFFGHVRGAFTGAHTSRQGCFELADKGTLFLDEIGDMPLALQAKILRVLEDGYITPIGGTQQRRVDVRVLAATNADLPGKIAAGEFRSDVYFRLARFTVEVPPLRARQEDIPMLAQHFLTTFATEMGKKQAHLSQTALQRLQAYDFPGNIRELKNIIERAMIASEGLLIQPEHLHFLPRTITPRVPAASRTPLALEIPQRPPTEEDRILAYVRQNGSIGNAECQAFLQVDRHHAFYRLDKMLHEGHLVSQGMGRGRRYYLATQNPA